MTPALGLSPAGVVDPGGIGLHLLIDLVAIAILAARRGESAQTCDEAMLSRHRRPA